MVILLTTDSALFYPLNRLDAMNIYSYTPHTLPGPNGYTIRFNQPADDDSPNAIELITIDGRHYVGVPSGTTMPAQPAEIDWRAEPSPPDDVFQSRWQTHVLTPMLDMLANTRWQRVASGTLWNSLPVKTGPGDVIGIHVTYSAAQSGSRVEASHFKFGDGVARPLTNAEAIDLGDTVFGWVQAHFDHEADLADQLRDGLQPDLHAGWPA